MNKQDTATRTVLIMGAGYVGMALAKELHGRDIPCIAAVTSRQSAERLQANTIDTRRLDLDSARPPIDLPEVTQVVYLVPPKRSSDTDERVELLLSHLPASVKSFVYVSTSGVYGDQQGRMVDETVAPSPYSARARRRLDAEQRVQDRCSERHVDWIIARVPGIYGPGRLPLQSLLEGRPVIRNTEANPGNRIHRDDLAFALAELLDHANANDTSMPSGDIYNVGDGCHMSSTEFVDEVARQAGLDRPPRISREEMKATASSVRWSFLAESRRLDSSKLHTLLTQPLRYLEPAEGIRHSLQEDGDTVS